MSNLTLPPDVADRVLDGLQNDPAYRARFIQDPRAALAEMGHAEAADTASGDDGIWACFTVDALPSPEEIADARAALRAELTSKANYKVFARN